MITEYIRENKHEFQNKLKKFCEEERIRIER